MYKKHALFDKIRICGIHQITKLFLFFLETGRSFYVYLHIMGFRDNVEKT